MGINKIKDGRVTFHSLLRLKAFSFRAHNGQILRGGCNEKKKKKDEITRRDSDNAAFKT